MDLHSAGVKKVLLIAGSLLLLIAGLFLLRRILINRSFLNDYAEGYYAFDTEKKLLSANIPESYLPHYNLGNAAYESGDYDSAVIFYQRALSYYIPHGKECDIRVNLALSMIGRIDFDHLTDDERIQKAIDELMAARDVLTEEGCADPDGTDGHDPEAEQLKQDIDRMIEMLKNRSSGDDSGDDETEEQSDSGKSNKDQNDSSGNDSGEQSKREKRLQEELEKQRENSTIERSDRQKRLEEEQGYGNGGGEEGPYAGYQGKQW